MEKTPHSSKFLPQMVSPHPNDPRTQIPEIMKKHRNCILTGLHRHVFGKRRCRRIAEKLLSSRSIIPIPRSAFENHSLHSKTRDRKKSPTPLAETRRRQDGKMKKRGREKNPRRVGFGAGSLGKLFSLVFVLVLAARKYTSHSLFFTAVFDCHRARISCLEILITLSVRKESRCRWNALSPSEEN